MLVMATATGLVESAAAQGAQLIVLPELFSCGYVGNEDIWRLAERPNGATVQWLAQMARRLDVYIGGGHPEFAGSDVLNVFTLAAPRGAITGRARKSEAEAYVFRRGRGVHVIDTALGRIGSASARCPPSDRHLMGPPGPDADAPLSSTPKADIARERGRHRGPATKGRIP
jgi:predicted amidohydrolase